ncbi:Ti-type conjugative transfer relaxase TraA [Acidisoma cellulosilytica]|uniref:Ti-type conjugative transfer relaxase TraA n=1 Tax=Acidisoma cellulosilyticum TaxID=2802395 RepID=A0A964E6V0_9PROT|nr:Ti-type conjugative transfer relaxase TraA [Acidisoma cellulosilyticum]MCB8883964.1 Ti-type conjugative transfer relaxase TraA [Acidisoma cellulosilyticum]
MAIYHLHAKVISRATGRSAVAAAAYRSASELADERLERSHDFTNKSGVVHSEILLPHGAPARLLDRATLWNEVERIEKRKDAQLARELEFSIPREMAKDEGIRLARDFVQEQFVDRGMAADLNVHWDIGADGQAKPHAHVMLATRAVGPDGFGQKARDWNRTALLETWRERWASLTNERLLALDLDLRIDHRTYAAQGIMLEPQNKIGPAGARREDRAEAAERADEHEAIARRNGDRIIAEPERVLVALTHQQSTFTRQDLARFVDRHTADADQFTTAMAVVEASPELVRVGLDGRGRARFSTREMLGVEQRLEATSYALAERAGHQVGGSIRGRALARAERVLGDEQRAAFEHVTVGADIAVVVGYAGTGKSTMLGVARAAWEGAGYRVRGAALSGIAAEGLETGSGIESRTLASLEHGWARGRDALTDRDVLLVDEAGMVGSRQMERVLSAAKAAGAKVVLIGDAEQLQAIEAGAAFRMVAERVGSAEITTVVRQREDWQKQATRELATGRTAAALSRYEAAGTVRKHATQEAAQSGLVAAWNAVRQQSPQVTQIMLAHRRVDVRALNEEARALRREAGELGADHRLMTERGARDFAEGDRIYFLKNERSLGVKNGTLGTVEQIKGDGDGASLVVRIDGTSSANGQGTGRALSFNMEDYAEIDHGYAATLHKSQGITVDRAHVLATTGLDRHMAYVGLSRHRESVTLHWSPDEMGSRAGLDTRLGRERLKDTSLDYAPAGRTFEERESQWKSHDSDPAAIAHGYAERRGLVSAADIAAREHAERQSEAQFAEAEAVHQVGPAPVPRRSKFAGLKLNAEPLTRAPLSQAPHGREQSSAARVASREPVESALSRAVGRFAEAVEDARVMVREQLPVLPHQQAAMDAGIDAILTAGHLLSRADVVGTFNTRTELITPAAENCSGRAAAIAAIEETRDERAALEKQAHDVVRHWAAVEKRYDQAGAAYEWDAQRQVGSELVAFAKDLKRHSQMERLLQERGPEFGIAEGSRLDRVVQAKDLDRVLAREIGIDHGPRHGRGMSLGM